MKLRSEHKLLNLKVPKVLGFSLSGFGWNVSFHVLTKGDILYLCVMPDERC